jgi:hypothetical protein
VCRYTHTPSLCIVPESMYSTQVIFISPEYICEYVCAPLKSMAIFPFSIRKTLGPGPPLTCSEHPSNDQFFVFRCDRTSGDFDFDGCGSLSRAGYDHDRHSNISCIYTLLQCETAFQTLPDSPGLIAGTLIRTRERQAGIHIDCKQKISGHFLTRKATFLTMFSRFSRTWTRSK